MQILGKELRDILQHPSQNTLPFAMIGMALAVVSLILWWVAISVAESLAKKATEEHVNNCYRWYSDNAARIQCQYRSPAEPQMFDWAFWSFLKTEWPGFYIALGFILIFSAPLAWDFLLRRIRDISSAARGE